MNKITVQTNKMLHAIFRDIAKGLRDENITTQEFIKGSFEMYADEHLIKYFFKQLSEKAYGVSSTQELSNRQIEALLDVFILKLGGYGIEINLPE